MPGFDRSGPMGNGPMTGGARGLCGSAAARKRESADGESGFFKSGLGCRRGFGGRRGGVTAEPLSAVQQDSQRSILETQLREMQQSLGKVQRRLDEL